MGMPWCPCDWQLEVKCSKAASTSAAPACSGGKDDAFQASCERGFEPSFDRRYTSGGTLELHMGKWKTPDSGSAAEPLFAW
jgi:hypothetical protein